ncbi:histidine kinase [Campylobacter sp. US33a]|uniref:histidine kinase n=1 Tax=Campylobacter sp. US33a TaxID=2498120 RepID=UPI001068AD9B|nr:histidine kinase [Campylobacter sp. US33a]TEY04097.1 histidine kinase [Campylobacter sp. US33a]
MQNYKKIAIEHFLKMDFKTAKLYFSLAYERRKNKRLFIFVSLCDIGLHSPQEALLLFEFYKDNYKLKFIDEEMEELLKIRESKHQKVVDYNEDENKALNYGDFLESEKNVGFKRSFENVIFSGKLIISDREDFIEFLEKLLDNGYIEMTLNYIESVLPHFSNHARFIKLQERLKGYKSDNKL